MVAVDFPDSYEGCITSFCDPKLFQKKFAFHVLDHAQVWACFGCHPHYVHLYNADVEAQLEVLAKHPRVSCIKLCNSIYFISQSRSQVENCWPVSQSSSIYLNWII